jgi:anti-anti-sigma factor
MEILHALEENDVLRELPAPGLGFLPLAEVAALLGVPAAAAELLAGAGLLPATRTAGGLCVHRADLQAFSLEVAAALAEGEAFSDGVARLAVALAAIAPGEAEDPCDAGLPDPEREPGGPAFSLRVVPIAGDAAHLVLAGPLGAASHFVLAAALERLFDAGQRRVILDCAALGHVSSTGLGTLVLWAERLREAGGALVLLDLPRPQRAVLELLGLDAFLPVADDLVAALCLAGASAATSGRVLDDVTCDTLVSGEERIDFEERNEREERKEQQECRQAPARGGKAARKRPRTTSTTEQERAPQSGKRDRRPPPKPAAGPPFSGSAFGKAEAPAGFAGPVADPFGGGPCAGGSDPFASGSDPFAGGSDPFAGGSDPFAGGGGVPPPMDMPCASVAYAPPPPPPCEAPPSGAPSPPMRRAAMPSVAPSAPPRPAPRAASPCPEPSPAAEAACIALPEEEACRDLRERAPAPKKAKKKNGSGKQKPEKKKKAEEQAKASSRREEAKDKCDAASGDDDDDDAYYPETFERTATVRYFTQMYAWRNYPLLVILSKQKIRRIVQQAVAQVTSAQALTIKKENPFLLIRPIIPGCLCVPEEMDLDVTPRVAEAKFWVTPQADGEIEEARVQILYEGKVMDEIAIPLRVTRQTMAKMGGLLTLGSTTLAPFLESCGVRLQDHAVGALAKSFAWLASEGSAIPVLFFGAMTFLLFLWKRPKEGDPIQSFFDFDIADEEPGDPLIVALKARVFLTDPEPRIVPLRDALSVIGSGPGAALHIERRGVETNHATLEHEEGQGFSIVPRGETEVQRRRARERTPLGRDAVIDLGGRRATLWFYDERPDDALEALRGRVIEELVAAVPVAAAAIRAAFAHDPRPVRAVVAALLLARAITPEVWLRVRDRLGRP